MPRAPLDSALAIAFTAAAGAAVSAANAQEALPDGDGRTVVEAVCAECHDLSYVTDARKSREQWQRLVTMMFEQGAPLEEHEIDVVIRYLAEHFGVPGS